MLRTPPSPTTPVRVGTDHEHFSGSHRRLHPVPPIGDITRAVRLRVANRMVGHRSVPWLCAVISVTPFLSEHGRGPRSPPGKEHLVCRAPPVRGLPSRFDP